MTGFERIVIQAASMGLASIMNRAVFEGGGRLLQWVRSLDETPERILALAAEQYVHNYAVRHGQLKVLGMREPVPLETIYQKHGAGKPRSSGRGCALRLLQ